MTTEPAATTSPIIAATSAFPDVTREIHCVCKLFALRPVCEDDVQCRFNGRTCPTFSFASSLAGNGDAPTSKPILSGRSAKAPGFAKAVDITACAGARPPRSSGGVEGSSAWLGIGRPVAMIVSTALNRIWRLDEAKGRRSSLSDLHQHRRGGPAGKLSQSFHSIGSHAALSIGTTLRHLRLRTTDRAIHRLPQSPKAGELGACSSVALTLLSPSPDEDATHRKPDRPGLWRRAPGLSDVWLTEHCFTGEASIRIR